MPEFSQTGGAAKGNLFFSGAHTMLVLCNKANVSASRAGKSSSAYKHNPFQIKLKSNLGNTNR